MSRPRDYFGLPSPFRERGLGVRVLRDFLDLT